MDYSIKIGGEAGQGIQTIGDTLARVFSRSGFHVFTHQDYESRIRGGHNTFQIRFSNKPVEAPRLNVDIIIALDALSITLHEGELTENGILIYDSDYLKQKHTKSNFFDIPLVNLAIQHGGSKVMVNTVAIGAVLGLLKMNLDILLEIIESTFKKKSEEIVNANIKAAYAGYNFSIKNCLQCGFFVENTSEPKMLISGINAIALGAIASGCKFYSAYPMTPSTGIMNYLASKENDYGIIVEQAEDEIAAINMAIGASYAGVRAMTGTAGGGFALMVEGLSLAGMTETPVVIALGQRPAPATGLPTRTEQADLLFAIHAAHGEFPRVVFAPGTPEQAFYLTNKAFDISEKYQIPAFIIFDQYLADSEWTFDSFDLSRIKFKDYRIRGNDFEKMDTYKRHAFTESGISPLGVPGDARHVVVTDSDEHDEDGHIIEDAETRIKMVQKRLFKKLPLLKQEIAKPYFYGSEEPEILVAGWGSTYGVIKEVVDNFLKDNVNIAMLHFIEIFPFPLLEKFDFLKLLKKVRHSICVENNAIGQFARLFRAETGFEFKYKINKYDGRPFTVECLKEKIYASIGRL